MKKVWLAVVVVVALSVVVPAQVQLVGTVGGERGYSFPYAEGGMESRYHYKHLWVFGETKVASGRKVDTEDGWHLGTRFNAGWKQGDWTVGGGYAYSKQWTSQYQKSAYRPVVWVGWEHEQDRVDGWWVFKGSDNRNGVHGAEVRYTRMETTHWGWRMQMELYRGWQTDRPKEKIGIAGAGAGVVYQF